MKIKGTRLSTSIACITLLSTCSALHAGAMGAIPLGILGSMYIGAFGGGGSIASNSLYQQGTALYPYGPGTSYINNEGPLAVNAEGEFNSNSAWFVGGHVGYRWPARSLNHLNSSWTFEPATELEGYYIDGTTLQGDDLNNATARLVEHDFKVSYPLQTGAVLVNAVVTANPSAASKYHPYVGIGVGTAIISITNASSLQTAPVEPYNHYNSDPNDTASTFAAQTKLGLSYDVSKTTRAFVEYRFLYLGASNYTFGSTSYPTHVATTNWDVKIGSQFYNTGSVGFQFDL